MNKHLSIKFIQWGLHFPGNLKPAKPCFNQDILNTNFIGLYLSKTAHSYHQWNSTFDMLNFAIDHIAAIDAITSDCDMKLRQYKLSKDEWDVVCQLQDVLKVHILF